jgi:hypothetical protein
MEWSKSRANRAGVVNSIRLNAAPPSRSARACRSLPRRCIGLHESRRRIMQPLATPAFGPLRKFIHKIGGFSPAPCE